MIFNIFKRQIDLNTTKVFESAMSQAANTFPERFGEETNSVEERHSKFEVISIFMALYAWYLKGEGSKTATNLSQDAYDHMFDTFEVALREQAVSDVRVGPEVKKLAAAFSGRLVSYGEALEGGNTSALAESFVRNHVCDKPKAMGLSISLVSEAKKMQGQTLDEWLDNLNNLKKGAYEPREFEVPSTEV